MKKSLIILILVALLGFANGQTITFHQGDKTHKKAQYPQMVQLLPTGTDNKYYVVEPKLSAIGAVKGVDVRLVDGEWKEEKCTEIDKTKDCEITMAFCSDKAVHVVVSNTEKDHFVARHLTLDKLSLKILSDTMLLDIVLQKHEECYHWAATSPDKQYHGLIYAVWNKKTDRAATKAVLYDCNMKKQWRKQLEYNAAGRMIVTNNGEIVTAVIDDDDSKNLRFVLNVADKDSARYGDWFVNESVEQMSLLSYSDGKVVMTALESDGRRNGNKRAYSGFHVYLYDMNSGKLASDKRHEFTDDEIRVLINEDADKKIKSHETDFVIPCGTLSTPQGSVVMYRRSWIKSTRNGETLNTMGIIVVKLDNNGNVVWTRGIMQNNENASIPPDPSLFEYGDKIYVLVNESKEEGDVYDPSKAAQNKNLIFANAAVAIYYFAPDGTGAKKVLEKEEKTMLKGNVFDMGNGVYCLLVAKIFPKIAKITIK